MKFYSLSFVFLLSFIFVACDQPGSSESEQNNPVTQNPSFEAELVLESSSEEKGTLTFTQKMDASKNSETSWIDFTLQDGRLMKIRATFSGHSEGKDLWTVELINRKPNEKEDPSQEPETKEISFDGKSASLVTKDDNHTIEIRPKSSSN